jgi:rare lipoprotein A
MLVLLGILTILGSTFAAGVYVGRIWAARSTVVAARVPDTEPARRGPGRAGRMPDRPGPQLTFYQELTAPLTAPPPPPRPAKTSPPPLVAAAPPAPPRVALAPRPGEQADALATAASVALAPSSAARDGAARISNRPPATQAGLAAPATTSPAAPATISRFTVQVAAYRVRAPADALRESLAAAGHDARVVEADANGPVYRVQIGQFATHDEALATASRFTTGRSPVTPFVTTR